MTTYKADAAASAFFNSRKALSSLEHQQGLEPYSVAYEATASPSMLLVQISPSFRGVSYHDHERIALRLLSYPLLAQSSEGDPSVQSYALEHRAGIEPVSSAWEADMLPLHQRCRWGSAKPRPMINGGFRFIRFSRIALRRRNIDGEHLAGSVCLYSLLL